MKFMLETGNESHTTSWQKCQAKFVGGPFDGKFLYQVKPCIISTEWVENNKHQTVVKTVYELPEGTQIEIDYKGHEGPEHLIIQLDSSQDVTDYEIGTSRLRTYTMKGRYVIVRDLVKEQQKAKHTSQTEGF